MPAALIDLSVTYGDALGPPKFHKLTDRTTGKGAALATDGGRSISLWVRRDDALSAGAPDLAPIVAVQLVRAARGTSSSGSSSARVEVAAATEPSDGFVRVGKDLDPDGDGPSLYLYVRRQRRSASLSSFDDGDAVRKGAAAEEDRGDGDAEPERATAPVADVLLSEPTAAERNVAGALYEAVPLSDADAAASLTSTPTSTQSRGAIRLWLRRQRPDEVDAAAAARAAALQAAASAAATKAFAAAEKSDSRAPTYAATNWCAKWDLSAEDVAAMEAQLAEFAAGQLDEGSLFWVRTLPHFVEDAQLREIEDEFVERAVSRLLQRLARLCASRYVCDASGARLSPIVLQHLRLLLGSQSRAFLYQNSIGDHECIWEPEDSSNAGLADKGGGEGAAEEVEKTGSSPSSPRSSPSSRGGPSSNKMIALRFASAAPRKKRRSASYFHSSSSIPTSYHWVGVVENFGRAGGFDGILNRLAGRNTSRCVTTFNFFIYIMLLSRYEYEYGFYANTTCASDRALASV